MKVSKESAARHKESLLKVAAAEIRKIGFDAINVTQLAQSAGLTHGALYSHFGSKQGLLSQACACAVADSQQPMQSDSLEKLLTNYLSIAHREHPELGCAIAALVSETRNQSVEVQTEFSKGVSSLVKIIEEKLKSKDSDGSGHEKAIESVAMLVGAVAISRAISEVDRPLADDFLKITKKAVLAKQG